MTLSERKYMWMLPGVGGTYHAFSKTARRFKRTLFKRKQLETSTALYFRNESDEVSVHARVLHGTCFGTVSSFAIRWDVSHALISHLVVHFTYGRFCFHYTFCVMCYEETEQVFKKAYVDIKILAPIFRLL